MSSDSLLNSSVSLKLSKQGVGLDISLHRCGIGKAGGKLFCSQ